LRGDATIRDKVIRIPRPVLASFVLAELLFGARRCEYPARQCQAVAQFAAKRTIVYPDRATLDHYVQAKLDLWRLGKPIPENDLWIAAICVRHDFVLAFRDNHFAHVIGLKGLHW
jgi:tRNA(fMet)-specific endonuclease VapC